MEIYINGERLDVYDSEVSMHFASMRFADAIQDEYSTDIEVPLNKHNVALLGAWGMLDRGQMFGRRVMCDVVTTGAPQRGYLHVTKVGVDSATCTLYTTNVPTGMWDAGITEGLVDDSSTIFKYDGSVSNNHTSDVSVLRYNNGGGAKSPNVKVNALLGNVADVYGVTIPSVDNNLVVLATKRTICPQNEYMCAWGEGNVALVATAVSFSKCGQHVAIDHADGDLAFTANRQCNISVSVSLRTYGDVALTAGVMHGTTNIGSISTDATAGDYNTLHIVSRAFQSGDTLSVQVSSGSIAATRYEVLIVVRVTDYTITSEDYDIDMDYIPDAYEFGEYLSPSVGMIPAVAGSVAMSSNYVAFQYIGTYCNIPDVSVRSFVNSLCWWLGKTVDVTEDAITFVSTDRTKEIDARITSMSPISDKLGKIVNIAWAGGREGVTVTLNNEFLEDVVDVHKSEFYGVGSNGEVLQYEGESFTEIEGLPLMVRAQHGLTWRLAQPHQLNALGITDLRRVMCVEMETYDDVSKCDYVVIDGHRYMVVEGDRDAKTGLTTLTALLV